MGVEEGEEGRPSRPRPPDTGFPTGLRKSDMRSSSAWLRPVALLAGGVTHRGVRFGSWRGASEARRDVPGSRKGDGLERLRPRHFLYPSLRGAYFFVPPIAPFLQISPTPFQPTHFA